MKLLWILTVPDYTRTVILAFILGLFGLSLFLATASIVTPLQGRGLRTIRGVWPILQPIILALFIVSWLSSYSELPHDQWWSPYLFLGGFGMLLLIGLRPQLIPLFRFLYRKCRRLLISNRRSNTESDGSIDVGPSGAPERASLGDRMRSLRAYCQLPESRVFWIATTLFIVVIEVCLVFALWDWLSDDESASATIRNVGLVIAGSVALPLAIWRALVADRQAAAAQRQADSARRSMLNERYQKGAEMLGSEVLSVRTGGIYTLQRLSEKYPSSYHVQVMRLFCAFVRHPTKDKKIEFHPESDEEQDEQIRTLRADVQDTMQAIGSRSLASISLERCKDFKLYLRGADMSHLQVRAARLILSQKVCAGRSRTNAPTPGYNIQPLFRILPQHTVALRCAKSLELPQNGFLRGNQGCQVRGSRRPTCPGRYSHMRTYPVRDCGRPTYPACSSGTLTCPTPNSGVRTCLGRSSAIQT